MRRGLTRVDELVATLLPKVALASHLQPAQLLDHITFGNDAHFSSLDAGLLITR